MSSLVGGTGIIGQDMVCGFGNGKYKTFEGTEISIENCVKARIKDLRVEGKTYQNLLKQINQYNFSTTDITVDGDTIEYIGSNPIVINSDLIKANTIYTLYFNVLTLPTENINYPVRINSKGNKYDYDLGKSGKTLGVNKIVFNSGTDVTKVNICLYLTNYHIGFKCTMPMLLEGDYTNTDLPTSIDGIESVAEREKNLVNTTTIYESMLESGTIGSLFNPKSNSAYDVYKMEIQPNTEYLFNLVGYGQTPWVRILDKNNITVKAQNLSSTGLNYIWSLKTESNFYYLVFNKPKTSTGEFKIYKEQNPYPLKLKINEENNYINLPIPLRSLPNGVADTIEGNKLVQRVEKVTLDENTEFNFPTSLIMANTVLIGLTISSIPKVYDSTISAICDKLQFKNIYNLDESGFFIDKTGTKLWLRLSISIYGSTLKEIKTNLALNPITIYYPLATPIIHNLEIPQLATTKGTNIITTTNNIKPKLSMKVKVKK